MPPSLPSLPDLPRQWHLLLLLREVVVEDDGEQGFDVGVGLVGSNAALVARIDAEVAELNGADEALTTQGTM